MSAILAWAAVALLATRLVLFVIIQVMPSEHSFVRSAFSDYAVGSTRTLTTAQTWLTGAAWAALAGAVAAFPPAWAERASSVPWLLALVVIFVVLPLAPTDLPGAPRTRRGVLHYVLAIGWFAISYNLTGAFGRLADVRGPAAVASVMDVLHVIALVSLIALVLSLVVPRLHTLTFGVSERVFLAAIGLFHLLAGKVLALA